MHVVSALLERALEAAVNVALSVLAAVLGRAPKPAEVSELTKRLELRARAQAALDARKAGKR